MTGITTLQFGLISLLRMFCFVVVCVLVSHALAIYVCPSILSDHILKSYGDRRKLDWWSYIYIPMGIKKLFTFLLSISVACLQTWRVQWGNLARPQAYLYLQEEWEPQYVAEMFFLPFFISHKIVICSKFCTAGLGQTVPN